MDTGAGMKVFDAPVTVAKVVSDSDVHESGVALFPMYNQPKYQVRITVEPHIKAVETRGNVLVQCMF